MQVTPTWKELALGNPDARSRDTSSFSPLYIFSSIRDEDRDAGDFGRLYGSGDSLLTSASPPKARRGPRSEMALGHKWELPVKPQGTRNHRSQTGFTPNQLYWSDHDASHLGKQEQRDGAQGLRCSQPEHTVYKPLGLGRSN